MFLGTYEHNIDEKGRLIVPARFREDLAAGAYVTQGFDHNLMVWTAPLFEQMVRRISELSITDPTTRLLRRIIFANAVKAEIDRVGRVHLPQYLREAADLDSDIVLVGAGSFFEIWSMKEWKDQNNQMKDSSANAQRFTALNLSTGL